MTIPCEVISVSPLTESAYRILLKPMQDIHFQAGQYLLAVMGEKDMRPFSIASSPLRDGCKTIELHIGGADSSPYAFEVVEKAQQALEKGITFDIKGPEGTAWFQETSQPTPRILIAGGTGFSYVRSLLEHCLLTEVKSPIFVYWGGRNLAQLYDNNEIAAWAKKYPNVTYVPVVEQPDANWQGKVGNVLEAVMEDFISLAGYDIYLAGRFEMAGAARELFCKERGADRARLFADAYSFI